MSIRGRLLTLAIGGVIPLLIVGYVVLVGVPSAILYASAWQQLTGCALVGLVVVFCTMAGALLVARSVARPVRLLSSAAEQFGEGNFSARAPAAGADEMSRLGMSFNLMAERLEKREARLTELDRLKSEFVSSVSHELRTPLTTIKALTRLLMRDGLNEAKRREYIETISIECDRQIDLVLNLLDLSRIEGGVFRITHERVDVGEVVSSVVKSETLSAEKRSHELRIEPVGELPRVCADPKALRRVLSNVIENAIKYTPDGGRIVLSARGWTPGSEVRVVVADDLIRANPVGRLIPQVSKFVDEVNEVERTQAEEIAAEAMKELRAELDDKSVTVSSAVDTGDPKQALVRHAEEFGADCIFTGATGFSNRIERFVLGSVSAAVAARAHCSVEVVRAQ